MPKIKLPLKFHGLQLKTFLSDLIVEQYHENFIFYNRPAIHRERRKFLRSALKELALVYTDQPGLLGPKVSINVTFVQQSVPQSLKSAIDT